LSRQCCKKETEEKGGKRDESERDESIWRVGVGGRSWEVGFFGKEE